MDSLPSLRALRAFDATGRSLTFRAAAEDLGVTQGAVAQQVRGLETELGVQLFERHARGLAFTPAGRRYHVRVQAAFAALREATETLRPQPDRVLISVTPTFAAKWLIPNLPDLTESHPEIDLQILATERVSRFQADGIDLAVRQGTPPFGASLDAHLLFAQEIIAVASPRVLHGAVDSPRPDLLRRLPKIHDTHALWPGFLALCGVADDGGRGLHLSQTTLAIDAAIAGQGVALASRFLVQRDIAADNLVQLVPEVLRGDGDFYLLSRRADRGRPALDAMTGWLRRLAGS